MSIKKKKWIFLVLVIVTFGRIWLAYGIPLWGTPYAIHDDTLLLNYAKSILEGNWLGTYNNLTLTKGVSFSIFLVVSCLTRIPYSILLIIYHILAILIFLYAIKSLVNNLWIQAGLYVFLLYTPGMMSFSVTQRIYRNALVMPTVLIVFAAIIAIYLELGKRKPRIGWGILGGIALVFFWNLREDSVWILPFCIVATAVSLIKLFVLKKKIKGVLKNTIVVILPLLLLFGGNALISFCNYQYYGVYTLNDRGDTAFADVVSKMLKVEYMTDAEEKDPEVIWCSREKFEYIIKQSESLSKIKKELLDSYDAWSASTGGVCPGDIFIWAMRDGASAAGIYQDAVIAKEFWEDVDAELQGKIDEHEIQEKKAIYFSFSLRGMTVDEIPQFIQDIGRSSKYMIQYKTAEVTMDPSEGSWEQLREIEAVTGSYLLYPDNSVQGKQDAYMMIGNYPVKIANKIINIYQWISPVLTVIVLILYVVLIVVALKAKKKETLWNEVLILTALLFSFVVLMAGVTWFTNYLGASPEWIYYYSTGAIPLLQLFQGLAIWFWLKILIEKKYSGGENE